MANKGGPFEREMAKLLSLWWTQDEPEPNDAIFWRTAGSGARATVRAKKGQKTACQHSDLCATDPIGDPLVAYLTIELKRGYSSHTIADLLDKPKPKKNATKPIYQQYEEWFLKVERDHEAAGTCSWLLITRRDKRQAVVFMPAELWSKLFSRMVCRPSLMLMTTVGYMDFSVVGILLDEFLYEVHPKRIRHLQEERTNDSRRNDREVAVV